MGVSTRNLATGAALLLMLGLGSSAASPPRSTAERGVRLALIRLNGLLSRRDMAIVDEFSPAADTLLVGPGAGERARGRTELETYFATLFAGLETLSYSWREVEVSVRGGVAWIHAEGHRVVTGADGKESRTPCRLAGVLEPHGARWQWRMFQSSAAPEPAPSA
jgi:ketosteroid isomerase-like protein